MKRRDVCLNVSASNQTPFQLRTSVLELFDSHLFITVCSRTYPCVSFRCQRVSHPGSKPGSRGLDGDGITDACQFPACCKEMGKSGVTPGKPVLFQRYSLTAESLYSKCKWVCLHQCCLTVAELYSSCLLFTSHMLMPVLLCVQMCEEVRWRGNRKKTIRVLLVGRCSVN